MRDHRGEMRPVGVECLQCGSNSSGTGRVKGWRRHPGTGEQYVCTPCWHAVRSELAKQRRQQEREAAGPESDKQCSKQDAFSLLLATAQQDAAAAACGMTVELIASYFAFLERSAPGEQAAKVRLTPGVQPPDFWWLACEAFV